MEKGALALRNRGSIPKSPLIWTGSSRTLTVGYYFDVVVFLPAIRSLERRARYLFYCVFCAVNDFSTTRGPIHAKVCMQAYSGSGCVFSPFGGWRPPAAEKGANEIFVTMGVNGEFLHFGGF